jgi:hypothetical protein
MFLGLALKSRLVVLVLPIHPATITRIVGEVAAGLSHCCMPPLLPTSVHAALLEVLPHSCIA